MRDSRLATNAVNSLDLWDISAIPIPVPWKLRRPFVVSSRTGRGRADGPAPKLITRDSDI